MNSMHLKKHTQLIWSRVLLSSSQRIIFKMLEKTVTYNRLDSLFKWQVLIINKFNLRCYWSNLVMDLSKIMLPCLAKVIKCLEWTQWCNNNKCLIQCRCNSNRWWWWTKCQWVACQDKECKCQEDITQWWEINSDHSLHLILIIHNED